MTNKGQRAPLQHTGSFFDAADDIFILFDEHLIIFDFNSAGLTLFKFKKEEVVGKHISEIFPVLGQSNYCKQYKEVFDTGEQLVIDDIAPHHSLGIFRFRIKVFKAQNFLGLVINNITDLAETIEEMNALIYRLTHDMRTPLINIMLLSETSLLEENADTSYHEVSMQEILKQAKKLDNILIKLYDLAYVRGSRKEARLIEFKPLLKRVLAIIGKDQSMQDIKITTSINVPTPYFNNKKLLISILVHLIDNAIKYRNDALAENHINVAITENDKEIDIVIEDDGIGIPQKIQGKIFNMFYRGSTKATTGSGLGLYNVMQDVKRLKGTIKVTSEVGRGTKFVVKLPNKGYEFVASPFFQLTNKI
jgi:signal transduction histidine kinase